MAKAFVMIPALEEGYALTKQGDGYKVSATVTASSGKEYPIKGTLSREELDRVGGEDDAEKIENLLKEIAQKKEDFDKASSAPEETVESLIGKKITL